jgi:excisionase family DNA binding protein
MYLTVKQIASRLGVSDGRVYSWCNSGVLPHVRLGGKGRRGTIRVAEADLEAFLDSRRGEERPSRPMPAAPDGFGDYYRKIMEEVERKRR